MASMETPKFFCPLALRQPPRVHLEMNLPILKSTALGETVSFATIIYLDIRALFVKVEGNGEVASPANDEH